MNAIELISRWDTSLFLFLNSRHIAWLDTVMWWLSEPLTMLPYYILILFILYRKTGWKSTMIIFLFIALLILTSDQLSVHLFKNIFQRLRPSHNLNIREFVHVVNNYRGGDFGFISSHASNFFATAVFLIFILRLRWFSITALIIAALVSYSRIYLGVHYPGDVLCGAAFGSLLGFLFYRLFLLIMPYLNFTFQQRRDTKGYT